MSLFAWLPYIVLKCYDPLFALFDEVLGLDIWYAMEVGYASKWLKIKTW